MKGPDRKLPTHRTILRVTPLEDRNHPGSAVGGPAGMGGGVAKGAGGSSAAGKNLRKSGDLQKVVQDRLVAIAAEIVARGV